jgi:2-polyprenyl-3-methyl-5-hydroxy-6-metoxy-1,4-benzoquinol methylase
LGEKYAITDSRIGKHGDIFKCRACGLAWVDSVFAQKTIQSYVTGGFDEAYEKERTSRLKTAEVLMKKIKKVKPAGKLLDIGCYSGIFLEIAQKHNYEIFGIEASPEAVNHSIPSIRENLKVGLVEEMLKQFPDNFFDVITLFDVIEHLENPGKILVEVRNKLKNDGFLIFSTPNLSSFMAHLQGGSWYAILPHHLYYFSLKNLSLLLAQNGFTIEKTGQIGRHFTLDYLAEHLAGASVFLSKISSTIFKFLKIGQIIIPVNFFDQLLIFAKKK